MVIRKVSYKDYEIELAFREKEDFEKGIHALMDIIGGTIRTLEMIVGEGAKALCYMSGKNLGRRLGVMIGRRSNIAEALDVLTSFFEGGWKLELWKKHDEADYIVEEGGKKKAKILFRDCIVRQTLEREGLPQKKTMCYLTNGFVVGALEVMLGVKGRMEFIHSGDNACLKEFIFE